MDFCVATNEVFLIPATLDLKNSGITMDSLILSFPCSRNITLDLGSACPQTD